MCCGDEDDEGHLPLLVSEMLAEYRDLHREHPGFDWGDELAVDPPSPRLPKSRLMYEYARFASLPALTRAYRTLLSERGSATWEQALRRALEASLPPGVAIVVATARGVEVTSPALGWLLPGQRRQVSLLLCNDTSSPCAGRVGDVPVELDAGEVLLVAAWTSAELPAVDVILGKGQAEVTVARQAVAGELLVRAADPSRWSVTDAAGYGWFAPGALEKFDFHDRPFFHAREAMVPVPVGVPLTVVGARGVEFDRREVLVTVHDETPVVVELDPPRLYDAASRGWYGGDLHVHVNYSGDVVATTDDAAAMQAGEGLHLMNLVAGNMHTARIYDREALENWVGRDLPWSTPQQVARYGVEYRNDLLGHVHALGIRSAPEQYQSGHPRSDHPADWPPNSVACEALRGSGGTVGYTHPVVAALADGDPSPVFESPRSVEARELPADAALGLVDSMDLLGPSPASPDGAAHLFHRLLNCGLRLAPTAGTDVFLSFTHCASLSNPPGFGRAYADLRGAPLSVGAWQDAVRAGRTFVTNGPWLEIDVDGCGPGDVLDVAAGAVLTLRARCVGVGAERLSIIGPDGELAGMDVTGREGDVEVVLEVLEPGWFAAVVRGGTHPNVLAPQTFAHTAPVHVEVEGRRIGRAVDAAWCLDWIDRVEALAREHGTFHHQHQLDDLVAVLDRARAVYGELTAS